MELRTLRYFLTTANEGNITKAAEILHVTQPTLSRQLMELERELNIKDKIDKGLVDIGLLLEPVDTSKYEYVRLSQKETWGVLMMDSHPLADRESISVEEIAGYPLILPLRENVRAEILNWLGKEERELSIPLYYTLLSNAVLMVEAGMGCAFCLDGALAIHSSPKLRFIPITPEHTTRSVLLWKKNQLFTPVTSLFIQEINLLKNMR